MTIQRISRRGRGRERPVNTAPEIADQAFIVAENAASGTSVGMVQATATDSNSLTFAIKSGNNGSVFDLNTSAGALSTAAALDYETQHTYTLSISVSDRTLSGMGDITIYVTNVIDSGEWDKAKEINSLVVAGNRGLWSDGTTMWVTDGGNAKIYAYRLPK
ncbi:MAG: cadherin repeat domain-containing protein [Ekhidna sp.]|nr:cadherin repeat domain-containing protein [Ekhidna sp.]MBC6408895.1 cadherin repeat domain-containing protein [Ekhidna sp.]